MNFNVSETVVVEAPPDEVFALITDINRLPEWNREIRTVHECPTDLTPGAEWVVEIHAMGTHWRSRSTLLDLDREAGVFAYESRSDDGNPSVATWAWRVAPHARGAEVHVAASVIPRTFWRRHLFSKIRSRILPNAVRASLAALRVHLSSPPPLTTHERKHA